MAENIRIAGIGGWHIHAKDFTDRIHRYPGAEVAAIWDDDEERGKKWAAQYGCPYYSDYDEILSDTTIDGVTITCETTCHYEMIVKAAKAGKHIYVEKPPFVTAEEARKAREVINAAKVKFMLGSPIVKPMHLKTIELLNAGLLGDVVSMRYRTVHELGLLGTHDPSFYERENNGGGVMLDMGNHALHLLSWFAGAPVRSEAIYTAHTKLAMQNEVDDNDIAVLEFENGVLGTIETGWISPWYQYGFDLYGTKGSVSCRAYEMYVCLEDGIWKKIPEEELPKPEQYPLHYWIDCIREDHPIERDDIDVSVLMTEMSEEVEAASSRSLEAYKAPVCKENNTDTRNFAYAIEKAQSGELGDILNVRVHCCGKKDLKLLIEEGKGVLERFFGKAIGEREVISTSGAGAGKNAAVLLEYEDKKLGIAEASCNTPEYEYGIDVCGTHGWLRIRGETLCYTNSEPGNRNAVWHEINLK